MAATTFGTRTNITRVAPTTTPAALVVSRARGGVAFHNLGTVAVYLGTTSAVTSSTGWQLAIGEKIIDNGTEEAIYAVTASGTGDVGVYESY